MPRFHWSKLPSAPLLALLFGLCPLIGQAQSPTPAVAPPPIECVPACRSGYLCHQGQCISACNPPCGPGTECGAAGQCVSAQAQPPTVQPAQPAQPTYPPAGQAQPAPVYNAGATLGTGVVNAPPAMAPAHDAPRFEERKYRPERMRLFLNFDLLLTGSGAVATDSFSNLGDYDYDLGASYGFGGGIEFRMGRIFALGLSPRYFVTEVQTEGGAEFSDGNFDFVIMPTFRIPIGIVEISIPINVGFALKFSDRDILGTGYGAVLGVTPGATIWLTHFVGLHVNFGYVAHLMVGTTGDDTFLNVDEESSVAWADVYGDWRLTSGVSFGF